MRKSYDFTWAVSSCDFTNRSVEYANEHANENESERELVGRPRAGRLEICIYRAPSQTP